MLSIFLKAIVLLETQLQIIWDVSKLFLIFAGPLPPSRRRSLFTLAASMVLFSSKAFNLFPLADFTKVALQGPMVR